MKKILLIPALLLVSLSFTFAQSPVPDQDTIKNPVKQGDPAPQVIPPSSGYRKSMVAIKPSQVPEPVRKRLEHSAYEGWEKKATIYRNQSASIFLIEFKEKGKVRSYRFDRNGQELEEEVL